MSLCVLCHENEALEPTGETIDCVGPTCFECRRKILLDSQREERVESFSNEGLANMALEMISLDYW